MRACVPTRWCTLYVEDIAAYPTSPLRLAQTIAQIVAHAPCATTAVVAAVFPPTPDGDAPAVLTEGALKHAMVVVDDATAKALLQHWGWRPEARMWLKEPGALDGAPDAVAEAAYARMRCMDIAYWHTLHDEYVVWKQELVGANVAAARRRATAADHERRDGAAGAPPPVR
ncbi:hypothetical protein MSPP1_002153 [Malassezia sp. CBS 17886]|nr:hypothetical protein MSPP1_002153 [Malassezia sp. CBS 17886]